MLSQQCTRVEFPGSVLKKKALHLKQQNLHKVQIVTFIFKGLNANNNRDIGCSSQCLQMIR